MGWHHRAPYEHPLEFGVDGRQVITGFSDAMFRLREGESRTVVLPPEAFGTACGPRGCHGLEGRILVFVVELVRVGGTS